MRVVLCCLLVIVLSVTSNFAQKVKKVTVQPTSRTNQFVESEKAWMPFWQHFRDMVSKREEKSIREMMSEDFQGIAGYVAQDNCGCRDKTDGRDGFFCFYNCQEKEVWVEPFGYIHSAKFRLTKIRRDGDVMIREFSYGKEIQTDFVFEYREDKKWYFARYRISGWG